MKKRSAKIKETLFSTAKNKSFYTEMNLYIKEAHRLKKDGLKVERVFSEEHDHPERNSFLYRISWTTPLSLGGLAHILYQETVNSQK